MKVDFSFRISMFTAAVFVLFSVVICGTALAGTVESAQINSSVLQYEVGDESVGTMDISECVDPVMSGDVQVGTKFCLCQGVAFRVAQLMSQKWPDGVFHVDDARVVAGWKTDGPEEFFVDALGMAEDREEGFSYDKEARVGKDQYVEDAWYEVTVLSTGKQYIFSATDLIYDVVSDENKPDFLEYRRKVKAGTATQQEKAEMQALRSLVQARIESDPFAAGSFWILEGTVMDGLDQEIYSNTLEYRNTDGSPGFVCSSDCYEYNGNGGTKFCLCQGVAFRISQMMRTVWQDGVFHPDDVMIMTSWNTDGPVEFFSGQLGVASENLVICGHRSDGSLDPSITPPQGKDLTLADSRYEIYVPSTGENYVFQGTNRLYKGDFLKYRSEVKNGDDSNKLGMVALRKEVESNLQNLPFTGMIQTSELSSAGSSSGGCNMTLVTPAAAFLLLPLLFFLKR